MIKLYKKAIEDAATSNNGKNESIKLSDSFTLSDKIRTLYRYFRMSKTEKESVILWINSIYLFHNKPLREDKLYGRSEIQLLQDKGAQIS